MGPNHDGDKKIKASKTVKGKEFWAPESAKYYTSCHSNGPFVRTPQYWEFDLKGKFLPTGKKSKRVLPNEGTIDLISYGISLPTRFRARAGSCYKIILNHT
ncbi:hypothetical protein NTGBS_890008 [Candidatus Nitrotoga sp. BS]|nr:hypothetical protein NTGBS_890008 [Candidatus Nitrotoga sp. BS]